MITAWWVKTHTRRPPCDARDVAEHAAHPQHDVGPALATRAGGSRTCPSPRAGRTPPGRCRGCPARSCRRRARGRARAAARRAPAWAHPATPRGRAPSCWPRARTASRAPPRARVLGQPGDVPPERIRLGDTVVGQRGVGVAVVEVEPGQPLLAGRRRRRGCPRSRRDARGRAPASGRSRPCRGLCRPLPRTSPVVTCDHECRRPYAPRYGRGGLRQRISRCAENGFGAAPTG